jgi:hypothetical protein
MEVNLWVLKKEENLMVRTVLTICGLGTLSNKLKRKDFCYFVIQSTNLLIKILFSNAKLQDNSTGQITDELLVSKKHNRSEMAAVLGPFEALPYSIHTQLLAL